MLDINECLQNICGLGTCLNNIGSYMCTCNPGYQFEPSLAPPACQGAFAVMLFILMFFKLSCNKTYWLKYSGL